MVFNLASGNAQQSTLYMCSNGIANNCSGSFMDCTDNRVRLDSSDALRYTVIVTQCVTVFDTVFDQVQYLIEQHEK